MAAAQNAERIVLVGPPASVTGVVRVSNPGTEKLNLKFAGLQCEGHAANARIALRARLAPGETRHAPVSLSLDPRTPPGRMRGHATIGDETRDVVIDVLEHRAIGVAPAHFALHGRPGARVSVPVVLTNLGNVPYLVPRAAVANISRAAGFDQLFHVAIARSGADGYQAALDTFAQLLHDSEVQAPRIVVGTGANESLAPGSSIETELTFELPADLARHRRYLGSFVLGGTVCPLEIEVEAGGPDGHEAADTARPRTTSKASRKAGTRATRTTRKRRNSP
ncbi:MAG TPA: hypothetical protein VFK29_03440 [Rhodanobacteraceae bacterium]|jgi:hypothetical protein|nr:hypothetical protein [Rhodanobacteraceae bacterium]